MHRIIVSALLAIFSQLSLASSYTVELTQQQLQQQLTSMMPISKEHMFVTVTVSDPALELGMEGYNLGMLANLRVKAPGGVEGTGRVKIVGDISYNKNNGSFYFYKPKISHLEIDQVPPELHSNIRELAQLALSNTLKPRPIFTLNEKDASQKMAKSVLQSVNIVPGKVILTLGVNKQKPH